MRGTMTLDLDRAPDANESAMLAMYGIDIEDTRLYGLPEDFDEVSASTVNSPAFVDIRTCMSNGSFTLADA